MRRPVVFVTDYGLEDTYAAALRGAAMRVDPGVHCIDGTHNVAPGDALAGAYHLKALTRAFGRDAVYCAIVDPGVGTARRAIAVDAGGFLCVAPDNGLLSYLWREAEGTTVAVALPEPFDASATFHGRDLFAPTAARLAAGTSVAHLGAAIRDPVVLEEAFALRDAAGVHGRVAVVDHFGNAITTIQARDLRDGRIDAIRWKGGEADRLVHTYDDIRDGVGALIGSAGHLEIAARGAHASSHGGPQRGDPVTVVLR